MDSIRSMIKCDQRKSFHFRSSFKKDDEYKIIEDLYPKPTEPIDWKRDYSKYSDKDNWDYLLPHAYHEWKNNFQYRSPTWEEHVANNYPGSDILGRWKYTLQKRKWEPYVDFESGLTILPDKVDVAQHEFDQAVNDMAISYNVRRLVNGLGDYIKNPDNIVADMDTGKTVGTVKEEERQRSIPNYNKDENGNQYDIIDE